MSKIEKKLAKVLFQSAALEAELQLILPPKIFNALLRLAEHKLRIERNSQAARDEIAGLAFLFRQESYARFGHETLETFALGKLLKAPTSGWKPKPPRPDSLTYIASYKKRDDRLSPQQEEAAHHIRSIWAAFGRFLSIGVRGMEGGGGKGRVIQPVEVMGEELWKHHKTVYVPWYNVAKTVHADRRRGIGQLSLAAIVFKILEDDLYPEQLDASYSLRQGMALEAFKFSLDGYHDPEALKAFGRPPETGKETGKERVGAGNRPSKAP